MIFLVQIALYCLLFAALVKCAAKDNGINCLYFYPDEYLDEAQKRGIANKEATMKKGKRFMVPFCIIMLVALILIIAVWNHVTDFKTAYIQSVIFLVIMNWFDGIVIDQIWVGHSRIWKVKGMEDVSYVKPWKYTIIKRSIATVMYLVIGVLVAGIVVFIGEL